MVENNKPTHYWPIGEFDPPGGLKKKIAKETQKKKHKSPGSPHKKETKKNIKKALAVGELTKKRKDKNIKTAKKAKEVAKNLYTEGITTSAKKIIKGIKETPKRIGKKLKQVGEISPEKALKHIKTYIDEQESRIPGREEAYLNRNKGGSVKKYKAGGLAKRGYGKARR